MEDRTDAADGRAPARDPSRWSDGDLLRAVVQSSSDAVYTKDLDGTVLSWNPGAEQMYGFTADEAIGRNVSFLVPPDRVDELNEIFARLRRGDPVRHFLTERIAKDGSRLQVSLSISPIADPAGRIVGASSIARDVTNEAVQSERLREATEQLRIITESGADGITIQDRSGQLLYANEAAARMSGFESADSMLRAPVEGITSRFRMLDEGGGPLSVEDLPGRKALRGEGANETVMQVEDMATGSRMWTLVRASPVYADDGDLRFAVNLFHDITDLKETEGRLRAQEEQQRFLAEASRVLAASLDWERTLQHFARFVVPRLADWVGIDILNPDDSFDLIAVGHEDPELISLAFDVRRRFPDAVTGKDLVASVIASGEPVTIEWIEAGTIKETVEDPEAAELLDRLGFRSVMMVPLAARGRTIGVLELASAESERRFGERDLAVVQDLAQRAALAIDNARAFRERSEVALMLQRTLLPPTIPEIPGFHVAVRYHAAGEGIEVGGDFYDVFETSQGAWALVVGDVCGRGIASASLMAATRHTTRTAALTENRPSDVLRLVNRGIRGEVADGRFATVCFVRLRPADVGARLTISAGGHPLPVLVKSGGGASFVGRPGNLLGVFPDEGLTLSDASADLESGDALVLYTDGLTDEHRDGEEFGERRLLEVLETCAGLTAEAVADRLDEALERFNGGHGNDDVTILVVTAD